MSRFYGSMQNERKKKVSKGGTNQIAAHIRTWGHGIYVRYKVLDDKKVEVVVYETGGSDNSALLNILKRKVIDADKAPNRRPGSAYYGEAFGEIE